ncbi:MAG: hypothetical protein IR153_10155 [Flavobacterium sp.]|nr:hypothetical protein [Flavobacterium sp.]
MKKYGVELRDFEKKEREFTVFQNITINEYYEQQRYLQIRKEILKAATLDVESDYKKGATHNFF